MYSKQLQEFFSYMKCKRKAGYQNPGGVFTRKNFIRIYEKSGKNSEKIGKNLKKEKSKKNRMKSHKVENKSKKIKFRTPFLK